MAGIHDSSGCRNPVVSVHDHTLNPGQATGSTTIGIYRAFIALQPAKFVPRHPVSGRLRQLNRHFRNGYLK
jgi:hypothetical protein